MKKFNPKWYTIPEFADEKPICVYHKEQEPGKPKEHGIRNLHVLGRTYYEIEKCLTGTVWLRITADDYYKLYINKTFVGQGPAPAYPEAYYYNKINITPYLKNGKNVLAVHIYYQGLINRVWNSGDNRFGVAADIITEHDNFEPKWKYQITQAYSGEPVGYETQFLENFDGRLWEENWNSLSYDDSGWQMMMPAQVEMGYCFQEQSIKPLAVSKRDPAQLIYRSNPLTGEMEWFVDMGQEITGALNILAEGKEGSKVKIHCGEECDDSGNVCYEMRCGCRYEEEWILREGHNILEPFDYKGFRYAQIIPGSGAVIKAVTAEERHYPMEESACTFRSENKTLDQIFKICKNAVKCGTQEGYLDCPTREKGQYLGDAIVTAHAQVWLTGSVEMLRKCISQFALTDRICPGLMGVAPGSFMQEIADFSLLWSQFFLLDYKFTKDREFLRTYYPTVKKIIRHFSKYERADGLLCQVADKWNLVDWPENLRDDYDFPLTRPVVAPGCHNVINALYIGAIKSLMEIEEILEIDRTVDFERRKASYIKAFYRTGQKLFADSETSSHCALHSNIYPLYFGLVPVEATESVAGFLLQKGLCCGVMVSYYYLKALAASGYYQDVYQTLLNETKYGWVNMLREGATACFEAWGKEQKWNTSLCHPWACAPIPVLIEDVIGFAPDPAQKEGFRFNPHIPKELNDLELTVPFNGRRYTIIREQGKTYLNSGNPSEKCR